MTRTLVVGDLHCKPALLPLIAHAADRERADRIVQLGDVCDDWHASNRDMVEWAESYGGFVARQRVSREYVQLLGNHDVIYLLADDPMMVAMLRDWSPGFKPGARRPVHDMLRRLGVFTAWSDGVILASHAGVTAGYAHARGFGGLTAAELADRFAEDVDDPARLAGLMRACGRARGGIAINPSYVWADSSELAADPLRGVMQIVGHTPVRTVIRVGGLWFCDTMSTTRDGGNIGDRTMLVIDDAKHADERFEVVSLVG